MFHRRQRRLRCLLIDASLEVSKLCKEVINTVDGKDDAALVDLPEASLLVRLCDGVVLWPHPNEGEIRAPHRRCVQRLPKHRDRPLKRFDHAHAKLLAVFSGHCRSLLPTTGFNEELHVSEPKIHIAAIVNRVLIDSLNLLFASSLVDVPRRKILPRACIRWKPAEKALVHCAWRHVSTASFSRFFDHSIPCRDIPRRGVDGSHCFGECRRRAFRRVVLRL
mmetsp:Transcript_19250/g.72706  ORF Transcript_19250/g.72706 Transcript_19250/m.72706 type:complete len:221 (-) Transcript_19250:91-753(-)